MAGVPKNDLTNKDFGELHVENYIGRGQWLCTCSCGKQKKVDTGKLLNGYVTSCGHDKNHSTAFKDITGQHFGEWEALNYEGNQKWYCRCSCGVERIVDGRTLRNNLSTSCGHERYEVEYNLKGKHFGEWEVLEHKGGQNWLCRCSCGTTKIKNGRELRIGNSLSCGCKKREYFNETMIKKYGDTSSWKKNDNRTEEQREALTSSKKMMEIIKEFNHKPTIYELSQRLNIIECMTLRYIHNLNLEDLVDINPNRSKQENELERFIRAIVPHKKILLRNKSILKGKEIDIYIPDIKTAIEFNGTYWHSTIFKEYNYHVNKSIECWTKGIRLIHIFEYEWINNREKIEEYLKNCLNDNKLILHARNCEVKQIEEKESKDFLNTYHLQGNAASAIRYGLFYKNELFGVMTFGIPRFNKEYQYELIRFAWKNGYSVVGGAEKLFKRFINEYDVKTVISYCDASKFTGKSYTRLGFKLTEDKLTSPGYVWVGGHNKEVLSRYQTMKQDLVKSGMGTYDQTESEIMGKHGYLKIYNCGNFKLIWKREED